MRHLSTPAGLDLNELALFVEVVRAGSFAATARHVGIPASTVSRRILALEEHLGARLMHRSTRKLVLTEAGRTLHERARAHVEGLKDVARAIVGGGAEPMGTVRVAAPADFMDWFVAEWVSEFLAARPNVRIEMLLSDAVVDIISEGIDLAFRGGKLVDSSLVTRRIADGRAVLVASPDYLAKRPAPAAPDQLQDHDCVTSFSSAGHTTWRLDRLDASGAVGETLAVAVTGRFSANTIQAQARAAVAGLGVALLPTAVAGPHLRAGRLRIVMRDWGLEGGGFSCIYPSRRQLSPAVAEFIVFAFEKMEAIGMTRAGDDIDQA